MKCLYYLAPSLVSAHQISDDLRDVGIDEWHVHVISQDEAGLKNERLHSSNWLETKDLLREGFIGANIGFIAGYTRSLLKVARGEGKARVGDLFNAWDCFASLFVFVLINLIIVIALHFIIPVLGTLASLVLGFFMVPGGFLIIDKGRGVSDAFSWCFSTIQADFVNWLLAYLVGNVIIGAGFILLFVGIILTAPLGELIIIRQYERVKPAIGN